MKSKAKIRVELKQLKNASHMSDDEAFRILFAVFKKQVNESGILTDYKLRQSFESEGQKKRRKKRESAAQRRKDMYTKDKLKKYFPNKKKEERENSHA